MSATQPRDNKIAPKGPKLAIHQINPSYTVRVVCCVFFIFLTEIFLAHYVYSKMSATQPMDNKIAPKGPKLAIHHINPSYTVRVVCCAFFIILTEVLLAHYVYRLIISEIRENYLSKPDFRYNFQAEMRTEAFREEVLRIITYMELKKGHHKFEVTPPPITTSADRKKRSVGVRHSDHNFLRGSKVEEPSPFYNTLMDENDEDARSRKASLDEQGIWVTSSSRIQETQMVSFCKKIKDFCPQLPGPKGDRGDPGLPGVQGRAGPIGPPGPPGIIGPMGMKGSKGDMGSQGLDGAPGVPGYPGIKGEPGRPGLDGLIGIPGTPGLDGLPGRNGHDGIPGKDGIPGRDGLNGMNGEKGLTGSQGPRGPPGDRGIPGPRGKHGRPGTNGTPGLPGISAYKFGGSNASELLIPPMITGTQKGLSGPISVDEGQMVRLYCSATGNPTPKITWQRLDRKPINRGAWQDSHVTGTSLNITTVNREDMGKYLCTADNGIPPAANHTFDLEVTFSPLIKIANSVVEVANGSTAVLECDIEAFPEAIRYWERSDGRLLENGDKFRIDNSKVKHRYKSTMQLNISRVTYDDMQYLYRCISKNEKEMTIGEIRIQELDPTRFYLSKKYIPSVTGSSPPAKEFYDNLCPMTPPCPACDSVKCTPSGVNLIDLITRWEIRPYGDIKYQTANFTRTTDCLLYAVGKPVYNRFSDFHYGCWMADAHPDAKSGYTWVTNGTSSTELLEFSDKNLYRKNIPSMVYRLDHPFSGNSHVVYNGFFFYNVNGTKRIIKYSLADKSTTSLDLPGDMNRTSKLYSGQYNYVDFAVDENGLWLIFAVEDSNNTAVMKVDYQTMTPQYTWNISIEHQKVGEMFIVCGVLYAVDSVTDRNTKIRVAFDLYKNVLLDVNLQFSNPFRKTTMLSYNHRTKELYSWDKGNQLTYPVRSHDIGYNYNQTSKDDLLDPLPTPARLTGFEIVNSTKI